MVRSGWEGFVTSSTAKLSRSRPAPFASSKPESRHVIAAVVTSWQIPAYREGSWLRPLRGSIARRAFNRRRLKPVVRLPFKLSKARILDFGLHRNSNWSLSRICLRILEFPKEFSRLHEFLNFRCYRHDHQRHADSRTRMAGRVTVAGCAIHAPFGPLGGT